MKLTVLAVPFLASTVQADAGLVEVASPHDVKETVARLEAALAPANVTVAAKIDHAAAAAKVGEQLPPTVLLVFGSPKLGTPLMHCAPSTGIDLPLEALVRDDGRGRVTLTYSDPAWIAARHGGGGEEDGGRAPGVRRGCDRALTNAAIRRPHATGMVDHGLREGVTSRSPRSSLGRTRT